MAAIVPLVELPTAHVVVQDAAEVVEKKLRSMDEPEGSGAILLKRGLDTGLCRPRKEASVKVVEANNKSQEPSDLEPTDSAGDPCLELVFPIASARSGAASASNPPRCTWTWSSAR